MALRVGCFAREAPEDHWLSLLELIDVHADPRELVPKPGQGG
jgi:hypothetical protein